MIQDFINNTKVIDIDGGKTQIILEKHPIISYLYQYDYILNYDSDGIEQDVYGIKKYDIYSKDQQKELKTIQQIYSQEIQKLIDYNILSYSLLEYDSQKDYQVDFGTITKNKKKNIEQYDLEQIYRLNTQHDKTIDFHMDGKTHKIVYIAVRQSHIEDINQDKIKRILWGMIQYLELDDIDDWNYNQNGYESYQSKLRISFENSVIDGQQTYLIKASILYSIFQKQVYIRFGLDSEDEEIVIKR